MQSFASLPEYGRFLRCTLLLTIGAIAACGSSDDSGDDAAACPAMIGSRCVTAEVAQCFAQTPTITQGVYGCVAEQPDVGTPPAHEVAGWQVDAFADADGTVPAGSATTSAVGFYEIAAPAGEIYVRNRSLGRTEAFTIPTGTAAVDLTISVIDTWQQR